MKVKNYFWRLFLMAALLLPGIAWGQVAKVSEYDFAADTVAYSSIVGNGGTAWSAADVSNGYTTIAMPFAMQYGQTSIGRGVTLYVSADGYVTTGDPSMSGIVIAPLGTTSGFTNIGANTIYTKVESNKVTVEWRKLKIGNNIVSFQLVLTNTGTIKFNYGPMTLSTTSQVYAGMQSSATDIYCIATINNRWDTIVPTYTSLTATRTLSPTVCPYYNVDNSQGLCYTFTQPECAKPNSFGAVPGDFNVIFNWTGNGSKYQIKYNAGADFAPMTEGTLIDNLTSNTYTLSDLPQRTTYYAYIRAYCSTSGSWSAWRAVADDFFTTGCGFEALPMTQDFTTTPECWDYLYNNDTADYTAWLSNDRLYLRAGDLENGYASEVYAVLPKFNTNVNLNNYEVDLNAAVENASNGTLTLGYITNINNMSGFVALTNIPLTTSFQDIVIYLTDYAAIPTGARLALKWSNSNSYWDCYVDQIVVKPQPTCFPISGLQVSDIMPTSAKFTFTDGHNTSTSYQLVYGAPGFDPDAATPVTITNGGVVSTLQSDVHYEAYVRALCGTETLEWIGPVDFFTPCAVSCNLTFEMEDSYGDGWNGNAINLYREGEFVASYTIDDGTTASYTIALCGGAHYSLTWTEGGYSSECSMVITHNGTVLYTGGAPSGTFANFRACPSCDDPSNIAFDADNNQLTWTAGTATQWQVKYALAEASTYTTSAVLTAASFSTSSLQGSSHYVAYIRSICGANDTNDWVGPFDFFTPCPVSCNLTFEMTDSYGDGWNGASIDLYQDGAYVGSYTVSSGSTISETVVLCGGSLYTLEWTTGTYDSECTMTITHNGNTLYVGGAPGAGQFASFKACPTCDDPADLAISSSKVLTWTAGNATQWQVRYGILGSGNYTTLVVNTNTATLPLTGEAGTQYEISVRSICGANDTNFYITPVLYTMPLSLPYSCDFENGATGFITQSTGSNEWFVGTVKSNGGNGYYVSNDGGVSNAYSHGSNIAYAYVTLPFENVGDYVIKYDWTANGESTWDFLRVALVPDNVTLITSYSNSYNSSTPSGWIPVDGGSKLNLNTNWNTRVESVNITTPGLYKLVFAWMNDGSGGSQPPAAIDNVSVRGLNCNAPSNIALNTAGAVAWTPGNTTQWQIRWAEQGSSDYTYAYVTTPSYAASSWSPNTSYTIDVRSICGANDTLDWMTYNFTMPCVAISVTETNPYTENFESYTHTTSSYAASGADVPQCWDLVPAIGVVSYAPHVGTQGAINGKGLVMTAGNSSCIPNNYAILPAFAQPVTQLQINFDYKTETASSNWLSIGYITNPSDTSTFVALQTLPGVGSTVTPVEFNFAGNTIPAGARIALRWYRASSYYWINIDNVVVTMVPSCVKPNSLAVSGTPTDNSAAITWNEINSATTWRVVYGPTGFNPENHGTWITTTTNPVTLTGLTANTTYDVYVRSVCEAGVDSSAWSNALTFRTACAATQSLPYAENFSGYTGLASYPYYGPSVAPACWDYYSNGTNTASSTSTSSYYGGVAGYNGTSYGSMEANNPYLYLPVQLTGSAVTSSTYINYGTQRGSVKIAAMPFFEQPISNLMISFNYKMSTAYSTTGAAAVLELGYITGDDFSTFQTMQSWNAVTTTQFVEQQLDVMAASAPANARLAFRFSGVHNGTTTSSYTNVACGIDNIQVKVIPNCFPPLASTIQATNVTNNSATVSWTDRNTSTPTSWSVKYTSNAIFDPATEGTATTVTTPSVSLTGLDAATTYYIYVGVDCGAQGVSDWSDPISFTTGCNPYTITLTEPYVYGFEDVAGSGSAYPINVCWKKGTNYTTAYPYTSTSYVANNTNPLTPTNNYCLYMYGTTTYYSYAVLPAFTNTLTDLQLKLKVLRASSTTTYGVLQVGVMTDPDDISTFQLVQQIQPAYVASPYPWNEFEIPLNSFTGTPGRLAIMAPATGTNYVYVDDIEVSLLPPCVKPSNVHTTALAYNAATIDWTQNSTNATESSWDVMFGPSPLDVNNATVTTLTNHLFSATGLDENTTYDFYVRANCGADGYSDWSSVYTFSTPCAPMAVTKYSPYVYGFEDVAGSGSSYGINTCWAKGTNSSTAYPYPSTSYVANNSNPLTPTNSYCLYMYGATSYYSYAVLPEFSNPLNTLQLSLKALRTSSTATYGVLNIGYMTDPNDASTFQLVEQIQPDYVASPYPWQSFTVFFDNVQAPAGARMAIMAPVAGTNYVYVDDIEVMPIPTCRTATNLASNNVYARTANLSWTESSTTTPAMWEVRYAPLAADLDNEGVSVYPTGTPTLALSNLIPETGYQWKVRAICVPADNYTGDTADWSTVANFTTTATCVVPTLSAPVATANSVTLSWTENTLPVAATQWEVAIGEPGFNQNIDGMHFTTTQNTNYVVDGLNHSTTYQVYVRSLCSDEDWSNWSTPANFNTSCAPWQYADMPLVQTFSVSGLPNCWTKAGGTASVSSGRMNLYSTNSMVILPQMGFTLDTIEMSLEAANYSGTTERSFQVGYLTDVADTTTFTAVETITLNSATYNEFNISFADINNTTARYIAIRGLQTGTTWADINIKNVQLKLRERIIYMPNNETNSNCMVFYMADTVNHEGTYAGNVNMTQTIYPGEAGKVLHLTGMMDCEYGYDYLTIYEGVGTNGTVLYNGTGYDANIDIKTDSYDWVNKGAMTIVFTTDVDNANPYLGFKLLAQCECPVTAPQRDWVVDTNAAFTWVNGRTYTNNVTVANQPDKSWSEEFMEKNVGGCDSVYHTLALTVHPTYTLTASQELCQRESYEFYGESFTTTGVYTRTAQTIYGADSTTTLTLQVRPAPTAYIYVNNERTNGTIDAFCDNADLVMTARSTIEGSTFVWEDNSTAAVRTVNPHESANYTVTAYDPTYNCSSLPVSLAVTTTPVPALSIATTEDAICAGGSTTLTVTDANNTGCTYTWSNSQTGNSITVSPATTTEYTVTATTPNASACTATASVVITVNQLPVVTIAPSATQICRYDNLTLTATQVDGYSYNWTNIDGGNTAEVTFAPTATGSYNLTVTDANGCTDNFTSATVTVRPAYNINDTLSICEAMLPYTWGTQTLNDVNGGDYDQTWGIAYGCDSTVHLHLDVTATGVSNAYATYCEGAAFTFGQGQYLTNHVADINTTVLSYVDTTSNVCPVQYNLYLTVNPNRATTFQADECDSYTWNNVVYDVAGTYTQNLQTVNECDSIVTMNLTLRASTTGTDVQTVCDKLVWIDGNTYTENNTTAQYTIENFAGCDSLVTLNLTVNYANTGVDNIRWCNTPTYTWRNGVEYDMNETDGTVRYLLPGVTNQYGCDSTQILNLVFNLAADTLAWADTTVCDIFILDTVACDGSLVECQIDQTGSYQLKTSIGNGRYVVSRYNVTINHSDYHTTVKRNVCLPYTWLDANDNVIAVINDIYNATGDTNISLTVTAAANGCDRTEVLRLISAKPQTYNYVNADVCLGESYTFGSYVLTPAEAGTEDYRLPSGVANQYGCDSTDILTLTVYPTSDETMDITLCENSFELGADSAYHYTYVNEENATETLDLTYPTALNETVYTGTAVANWTTENGCARTVTVNYTVNPNTNSTFDATELYTYTWNGVTYDNAGVYTDNAVVGVNQYGCDSIVTMNLTLIDTIYTIIDTNVCTSYRGPDGEAYREDKTFTEVLPGASSLSPDTVVVTNFYVNQNPLTDVKVASNIPYTWINGAEYTATSDAYFTLTDVNGCDSTLHLFFTKLDPIVLCSEALPYETGLGFTITDPISNTYSNNDPMGNDTIVSYIINLPIHNVLVDDGCDSYTWDRDGITYTVSGNYYYNYVDSNGCAAADTLKLTVYNNTNSSETVTACDTYTWTNNGNTVTKTESGVYYSNYLTTDNCPSVDTLYLTVNYNTNSGSTAIACDSYNWYDSNYTATGEYTHEYTATNGCASVDTLRLTIGNASNASVSADVCDSYTWTENGLTYTESTVDSVVYQSFAGCDSTITLNLTVRHSTNSNFDVTVCDTYTWLLNNETYTVSGSYVDTIQNLALCDSVVTLNLTVNYNSNSSETVTACNTYTWTNHGNVMDTNNSGTYYSAYTNAENGCPSVDTLYLTINHSNSYDTTIVSSEGFYQFNFVGNDVTYDTLFQANTPTSFGPLTATITNAAGCDSVITFNFLVGTTRNKTEIVVACQEYTWPRNNVTYEFINATESAAHNGALYKTTTGTYIYEAPIVTITNNNAIDSTFILQLVLTERTTSTADTTFLLSNNTFALGDSVFDFSAQKAAGYRGYTETVQREVHFPSELYCDSLVTYNINLVYNYDTAWTNICANQTSVEWGTHTYATTVTDTVYTFDTVAANGWLQTLVVTQAPAVTGDTTAVACDSFDWYEHTGLTTNSDNLTHVFTDVNGCDSTVTLHLTIKSSNTGDTTVVACDSYTWFGETYTASTEAPTHVLTNAAGCDSTVTLHLTINNASTGDTTAVACDSFEWYGTTYTASTETATHVFTNAANCDSTVTLHLTINKNTPVVLDTVVCDSFTWTDGDGLTYTTSGIHTNTRTDANTCQAVDTLKLTVNVSNTGIDEVTACDSLRWIDGTLYTINNFTAQHTIQNAAGCDSVITLNLTINHATHNITNITDACDSYVWTTSGMNYTYDANETYPLTITHNYVNAQNCPSVDTLKLTLHQSSAETFDTTVCESFTWENNGNTNTYTTSGTYTSNYTNTDGCPSTDMLYLVINHASTGNDEIVSNNGYYIYDNILYTADRNGGEYFDTTFTVTGAINAVGCDSTTMLHLLVGTNAIGMDNQVVCDHYTWINGHTYEYRDNAPEGALYYDATANEWVYARPRYTLPGVLSANGFDTIAVLNLTLTQINYTEQNVNFLLSQQMCYLTDDSNAVYTVNFSGAEAGVFDTVFHFGATSHYCDSVITYHINLINNYTQIGTEDICATIEDYTWDNTNVLGGHSKTFDMTEMITDFDHVSTITLTDTVFKGDANNEWVYAKVLTVHPVVYATERRTACDSYEWNGTVFTESTTTATRFFPNGSSFGCDSTVTLNLTIKYNSNTGYTVNNACDTYTWNLNNQTYTTSGDYTRAYTATNGCPSVDTLHLTVNYSSKNVETLTACDTYTWHGTPYTASADLAYNYTNDGGCPAVDSLYLTINHNSNSGQTVAACDSYEWTNNGNVNTYTTSGTYYSEYTNDDNCPSVDTLHLTINTNSGQSIVESVCDTYTWAVNGQTYTETGIYFYDSTDANSCYAQCKLDLTVGYTTNNAETVVACHAYNWHGTDYSTSDTITYSYTNAEGCPSVDTLYLTINNQTTYAVQTIENCGPYTWTVNDSIIGIFDQSIETSTSLINPRTMCDSVVFLRLTVFEAPHAYESATVCADALPYTWRGITFNATSDTAITTYFTDQCDSTIHFALTVNPLINVELTDATCLGQDYSANGFTVAAADLTAGTHTFSHTVPSVLTGCDSTTTLTLTVGDVIYNDAVEVTACDTYSWNAGDGETYVYTTSGTYNSGAYANAMGCTSIDVLALTINNNSSTGYIATACDSYTWNGNNYNTTGDYTYDYTDANGCASVDTLHLTINNNTSTAYTATACDSYTWNGMTYTTSGDYTYDYSTTEGCNSVDTLHLTVNYNSNSGETATACDSYTWNGTTYTTSGDYTYNYNTVEGCASVDTLHLTVNYNSSNGETVTACDSYTWNGQTYTSTGTYTYAYNTVEGCASVDTLHLTVNYNTNAAFTETACDSYTWNGTTYTTSGDYTYNYNTAAGCASTDTLHLTVNYNSNNGQTVTACDSYTWNGTEYTTSGTYYNSYNTTDGCPSVDTLYLTVKYNTNKQRTIIACDEYTWNGETYYQTGDYLYSYEANNGCPSVDTLHLTVNYNTNSLQTVVACDNYEWNGTTYNVSGTYTFDYVAANNCESTDTLVLTVNDSRSSSFTAAACNYYIWNNVAYTESGVYTQTLDAANGCDSVVTMTLTINTPQTATVNATACNSYTWNGATYTASGSYTYSTTSVAGCDSVVTLNLTINPAVTSTVNMSACNSYTWNGTNYTTSGNYTHTYTAANGCDSIVTLALTINPSVNTTISATACDSYIWNGATYTTSGNYTHNYTTVNGCDSIVTLNLTVTPAVTSTINATACGSYTWNGTNYTTSGLYTHTYTAASGCDSIVNLVLFITQPMNITINATACDSYTWNGQTYTTSGNYSHTYTAANGCDSIVTLALTVNNSVATSFNETACGSYTWNGETYTTSGAYNHTYTAANGCDSVVTLNLTVNYSYDMIEEISACDGFIWIDGVNYTESTNTPSVTLTAANGCDSVVTLHLTVNHSVETYDTVVVTSAEVPYIYGDYTFEETGDYALDFTTVNGCDSTVYLHFVVNTIGINTVSALDDLVVYPNPTHGRVTLTADNVVKIEVLDIVGRRVAVFEGTNTFDISNLAEGAYTLRITLPEGVTVRRVVKK